MSTTPPDPAQPLAQPSAEAVQAALDALEPWSTSPGSMALHDAVYALAEGPTAWEHLQRVVGQHADHPALPELRRILGLGDPPPPPALASVLQAHGPLPADGDLVGEVARRLERAGEVRRILDARVLQLEGETRAARRTANGVAFVGALVAIAALVGWAVALGWWEISWMDPPAPEPPAGERGQGSAAGAGSRPL